MKKFLKVSVILCLLCGLLSVTAFAADSHYSLYNMKNTGRNWNSTGSFNTKATAGASWYMRITGIGFGGASTSGTLGIAHAPGRYIGGSSPYSVSGTPYWSKTTCGNAFMGWQDGGIANTDYVLLVRLDDLITGTSSAYTTGWWNAY